MRSHDLYARYVCCIVSQLSDSHRHTVWFWTIWCALSVAEAFSPSVAMGLFLLCYSALMSSLPSDFSNISLSPASLPEFLVQPCGCMAPGGPGCGGGRCAAVTFWAGCGWSPVAVLITHQGFLCLFCRAPCYVSSLSNVHVVIM